MIRGENGSLNEGPHMVDKAIGALTGWGRIERIERVPPQTRCPACGCPLNTPTKRRSLSDGELKAMHLAGNRECAHELASDIDAIVRPGMSRTLALVDSLYARRLHKDAWELVGITPARLEHVFRTASTKQQIERQIDALKKHGG